MKKITVTLSDKAEKYFNEVIYSLDNGRGTVTTQSEAINEIFEANADFELLEEQSVAGWIGENYPLFYYTEKQGE